MDELDHTFQTFCNADDSKLETTIKLLVCYGTNPHQMLTYIKENLTAILTFCIQEKLLKIIEILEAINLEG